MKNLPYIVVVLLLTALCILKDSNSAKWKRAGERAIKAAEDAQNVARQSQEVAEQAIKQQQDWAAHAKSMADQVAGVTGELVSLRARNFEHGVRYGFIAIASAHALDVNKLTEHLGSDVFDALNTQASNLWYVIEIERGTNVDHLRAAFHPQSTNN